MVRALEIVSDLLIWGVAADLLFIGITQRSWLALILNGLIYGFISEMIARDWKAFEPHRAAEILSKFSYWVYKWTGRKVAEKPREKPAEIISR